MEENYVYTFNAHNTIDLLRHPRYAAEMGTKYGAVTSHVVCKCGGCS